MRQEFETVVPNLRPIGTLAVVNACRFYGLRAQQIRSVRAIEKRTTVIWPTCMR